ncbi:hypothetical protein BWQ96_04263 [Gracilariopsis chorda]|uniref:Uncharacterized protein n=1 Tax=Gracilariopsis chorda TaxID=448386 RepID=A0A2V3IXT7_9FLOR|nr:hypothetical protein BWQ96_04263 [Gracilariopsis chorda]|eukprot:PXF45950.1 hypothetical protein BWQ96_04263 [Gracilariopsis chorda]
MDTASTSDEYQELLFRREEYKKRYTAEAPGEDTTGTWSRNKSAQFFQIKESHRRSDPFHGQVFCYRPGMNDFSPSDAFLKFSVDTEASVLTASRDTGDVRVRLEASLQAIPFDPPSKDFSTTEFNVQRDGASGVNVDYLE